MRKSARRHQPGIIQIYICPLFERALKKTVPGKVGLYDVLCTFLCLCCVQAAASHLGGNCQLTDYRGHSCRVQIQQEQFAPREESTRARAALA